MFEIGPLTFNFKSNLSKIKCSQKIVIQKNELVVIAGPSGSGKSTLLQMLKGIIPEYSSGHFEGTLLFNDQPLSGPNFEKNLKSIVFLFQNPFSQLIFPQASEEFFFSMENFNYSHDMMTEKKEELKACFDLESLWDKKTTELSNGECQRLVLASLLAIDPEVLLLDEPTAFLDPEARQLFYRWIAEIKGTRTIVIVDHHLDEILPLCDKVINVDASGNISESHQVFKDEIPNFRLPKLEWKKKELQLDVSKLNFHYEYQDRLLENVSISAKSSEVIIIRGKNGKGKSTLFKLMATLIKPISGNIELKINGKLVPVKKQYKEIGFVFQNPESHFFYDTIKEELKLVESDKQLKLLLERFLKDVDISRSPYLLSEGEKRRLSILMTVFQDKSILFYDEPTFGQDKNSIIIITSIIEYLAQVGKIQFIISHNDEFIRSLNARVFEIVDYQLLECLG